MRYRLRAFDKDHNELWIEPGTSHIDAQSSIQTNSYDRITVSYQVIRTGRIIDQETGKPVIRVRNQSGKRSTGSRRIAYFRLSSFSDENVEEIYITKYGRQVGVRNYQARRKTDTGKGQIIGHAPIRTGPWIAFNGYSWYVVIGEGDPFISTEQHNPYHTVQGDMVRVLGWSHRVTLAETDGQWCGYAWQNLITYDHFPLVRVTKERMIENMLSEANEIIRTMGSNLMKW